MRNKYKALALGAVVTALASLFCSSIVGLSVVLFIGTVATTLAYDIMA